MQNSENVILVDLNGYPIGQMEKMEAHQKGLLHRAISVFIFNSQGKWLIQQRSLQKYHSSGLWTNTCCTHPLPGEDNLKAAQRRLIQEMNLQCELKEIFHFIYNAPMNNGLTEYELDHVFFGISDELPSVNPQEVMNYRYLDYHSLKTYLINNPEKYTVWFRKIFTDVHKHATILNYYS